nr:unnamed protein product [Callosobruchus chinensis]
MFLILLTTSRASPQRALNVSWLQSGQRPSPSSPHLQSTPDRQDLWGATTEGVLGVVLAGGQSTTTTASGSEAAVSAGNYLGGRSRRESRRSRRKFRVFPVLCG